MTRALALLGICFAFGALAHAQPAEPADGAPAVDPTAAQAPAPDAPDATTPVAADPITPDANTPTDITLTPAKVDAASCAPLDLTPGTLLQAATDEFALATPISWSEFEIEGQLVDPKNTVHALLEPTLAQYRTSLSLATMPEIALVIARFGYQLVGHRVVDTANEAKLVLHLAPLPLVRKVYVDMKQSILDKLLEDEVQRRMSIRVGSYLPWEPTRRRCALIEEETRLREFLYDEGYFAAEVGITPSMRVAQANLRVNVKLGKKYTIGKITIACPSGTERRKGVCVDVTTGVPYTLSVSDKEIRETFIHENCAIGSWICLFGRARFTRSRFQEDAQELKKKFQLKGFPSVRVVTSDPRLTFNRTKKEVDVVDVVVTIDERRAIDVQFFGYDKDVVTEQKLKDHLTFNDAGSADDVEIAASARELTTYLQTRGFFDARVTWTRERIDTEPRPNSNDAGVHFDRIGFYIVMGDRRRVAQVQFIGNHALTTPQLEALVQTKEQNLGGTLFGTTLSATSDELIADQDRIKEAYRRIGYDDARVWPSASPSQITLGDASATAALLGVWSGNDLFVRFTIEEGEPTLVSHVVALDESGRPLEAGLCAEVLGQVSTLVGNRDIAGRVPGAECAANARDLRFRSDDMSATRDQLRDYLYRDARPRAEVQYEVRPIGPHRIELRYTVDHSERLRLGKVVIRGNFRTRTSIIKDLLNLDEGDPLTTDRLAEGARRLRTTGLFDAVNIEMPELDCNEHERTCASEVVNAVVRVEERYDHLVSIVLEGGYSHVNGPFGTVQAIQNNLFGLGMSLNVAATEGTRLTELTSTFRIPAWLPHHYLPLAPEFQTQFTGSYRKQDTDRFGLLTTESLIVDLTRTRQRARTDDHVARVYRYGPSYTFRLRTRNVDALRPIGGDMDDTQVAVSTRTGALGVRGEIEQRVDRNGQLAPLAPEDGFRLEGSVSIASPLLAGQNWFLKASVNASKFWPVGKNLVLRADFRYDHGLPLGGDVMLPDVERFFAGGDNTVRGYPDERLKTEVIQVGVPPFDNVMQFRAIPAGANIRVLGSVDAQVRIWKILAGAMFADAGLLTNRWDTVTVRRQWGFVPDVAEVRPSVGMGLRFLTPFGTGALEYAIPVRPQLGDDPRGRIHFYFAARAQF